MPTEDIHDTNPVVTEPISSPEKPPALPLGPVVDYQAKYTGLQRAFDERRLRLGYSSWDEVPPVAEVSTWKKAAADLPTLQGQLTEHQNRLATISGDLEVARNERDGLKAWQAKVKLIATEAPDLIDFVEEIPTLPDVEQQKASIIAFQQKLSKRVGVGAGSGRPPVPPVPPNSPPLSGGGSGDPVQLYSDMATALAASRQDPNNTAKRAEYERLRDLWQSLR